MAEIHLSCNCRIRREVIVLDENDLEVPYQVTYNDMLIFPTSVKASSTATYTIKPGNPQPVDVISCGRVYPERVDDIAWENDRAAYRAYGPALQQPEKRLTVMTYLPNVFPNRWWKTAMTAS